MARTPNYTAEVDWLKGKGRNDYSQFGEDGLVEAALHRLGESNRFCFELGASDGRFLSNTLRLRELGWSALLIESDDARYRKLELLASDKVRTVHATATHENFNSLLAGVPHNCDFGSIDIDGQDYWLFDVMEIRPRVLVVEYSPYRKGDHTPARGAEDGQASLRPIVELGKAKGYKHVATTYCNAVLVYDSQT